MMRKSLTILVIGLLIVSFILGGCASQSAAPSITGAPTTSATVTSKPAMTTTPAASATSAAPQTTASSTIGAPAQVFELRFSHHLAPQAWVCTQFINPWIKKVEAATNGAVKITTYPAQSIATMQDNYDAVINGLAHLTWIPSSPYQGRFSLSEVMTLPFLNLSSGTINGKKVGPAVVNSHIIQELYETMPELQKEWAQTKLLFLHMNEPLFIITKKSVTNLSGVKGLKIAVLSSGPSLEMWKKMGASPVYMTGPAIYEAGQKGVLDGCTTNWGNLASFRYNEVFPYALEMTSSSPLFSVPMNLEVWNRMPPEVQKQIMSVSGISGAEFAADSAFGESSKNDVLAQIKKSGNSLTISQIDPAEQDKMKELGGKPIWDEWVASLKAKGLASDKVMEAALKLAVKYQ
jgi:TRAP-type transport system periplasmic protein